MGGGDKTPLILLHGGPGGHSCGFAVLSELGRDRRVIRYDQLGTGQSERPADLNLWRTERFVDELDAVRKALGLNEVHILGHSWGGTLATEYLLTKGQQGVKSVILSSPLISTPRWISDARRLRSTLPEWAMAPLQLVGMTATEIKALMNDLTEAERQSGLDEVERELDQLDQNIEELENLLLTTPAHTMDGIQAVLDMAVARFREQTVTDPNDVFYDYGDARTLRFLERAADDLRMLMQETHRVAS